ncbi:MAG: site-2 protease family protein [Pyrinomonadaceae bacterium]|nr:site-2 protease family protein [Pyrinomonadaceae bacterium]
MTVINIIVSFVLALVVHELGHLLAARLCKTSVTEVGLGWGPKLLNVRARGIDYHLRLLPLGAYVRIDMAGLQKRPLVQQIVVLFAGIAVNLILAVIAWGTFFGTLNLVLAIGNLLPFYQQDGWKIGMVVFRRGFKRSSPLVEWCFTVSGGLMGLALVSRALFSF